MSSNQLKKQIFSDKYFSDTVNHLEKNDIVYTKGLSYSLRSFFIAYLSEVSRKKVIFLADTVESAEKTRDDLFSILKNRDDCEVFLPAENYPYCSSDIDDERKGNRLIALEKMLSNKSKIIISTYRNLFDKIPTEKDYKDNKFEFKVGKDIDLKELVGKLADKNFEKVSTVEKIGEYSVKGNIVDIYPYASESPVRIELFDTEIESLRYFDPVDQKKIKEIKKVEIFLSDSGRDVTVGRNLMEIIDQDSMIFIEECDELNVKFEEYYEQQIIEGFNRSAKVEISYKEKYFTPKYILELLDKKKLIVNGFTDKNKDIKIDIVDQVSYRYDFKSFLTSLDNNSMRGYSSFILCDNPGQTERFEEILDEELPSVKNCFVNTNGIHEGFILPSSKIAVYTDHQIFGRIKRTRNYRRFKKAIPLRELKRLQYGDVIVHLDHGVGQFLGLEKIRVAGSVRDVVKLLYKDGDILFVKLDMIQMIQKYSARDGVMPTLSKLGGKQFKNLKEKTKNSVKSIARELIKLYAKRKEAKGHAYPPDPIWQTELEASFEFEDTPDQASAVVDFKRDMESRMPMDRLVCGDVGFGKTEVAIRAAFKAAVSGKQVAILAPTTILVHQHYENIKNRVERYPLEVDVLSRFKSPGEQRKTLVNLKEGKVDIIIGTHRLLSKDVEFKDLGLLIVDEEQRFGVKHKEKIKELRVNVDVMTLTATPIPRTLHMSLLGVRDLSLINTPPVNRLPIITEIHPFEEKIIFEGIMKEVDRGGQVFFVHNRVETIETMKASIQRIVPDVSIAIAHGQMKPSQLEKIMYNFMYKKYDVLIATTIIENGVDIPNVNTMIVNRADMFGLSQLYQLRGRIGRSSRQAYAYFLAPPSGSMTPIAKKRLETVSHFTDLGSGFQIAMKDLEIRGAGNLLGGEQSGFIENVGFDLYTRIMEEAVSELKEEEFSDVLRHIDAPTRMTKSAINLQSEIYLPEFYIDDSSERVEIYRRMMNCFTIDDLNELRTEVRDRFGILPPEAVNLFSNVYLSILGGNLLIKNISMTKYGKQDVLKFTFNLEEMEEIKHTEKALMVQENVINLMKDDSVELIMERDGQVVNFVVDKSMDKFNFTEKCLQMLGRKVKTVL
ncbi:MAG: transcription-repair coupling factor [Candidatus Delongbacteria bacterium]|jgi:transcription-repair coupling factor (superfamily II helicase)|nr:transcription-repair coupling factor [Candidatus Delongbacteria bacterium]